MAASRADRQLVAETIASFKEDLVAGREIDTTLLVQLRGYMNANGFSPESEYYAQIASIENRANGILQENAVEQVLTRDERKYAGKMDSLVTNAMVIGDHFTYRRLYDKMRFGIDWKFNREGKIENVDCVVFRDERGYKVYSSENTTNIFQIKEGNRLEVGHIPTFVQQMLPYGHREHEKEQTLLRFGFGGVRDLKKALEQGKKIEDFTDESKGMIGLTKILQDQGALYLMGRISERLINVHYTPRGMVLEYVKNNKT